MSARKLHELASLIVLARHGKAVVAEGQPDTERELNELGVKQAETLDSAIQDFRITVVLSSPLKRAMNTAKIATNGRDLEIKPIAELAVTDDASDPINVMWANLGNVPISQYFAHQLGEHLKTWGYAALDSVTQEMRRYVSGQKVLILGHALLQNALLWAIGADCAEQGDRFGGSLRNSADRVLGEGEAFVVEFNDGKLSGFSHLRPMAS